MTALLAPITMINHAGSILSTLIGVDGGWRPQVRDRNGFAWSDLVRHYVQHIIFGFCLLLASFAISPSFMLQNLPMATVLIFAPLVARQVSGIARPGSLSWRLMATPEDLAQPDIVRRAEALGPAAAELRTTRLELRKAKERRDIANNPRPVGPAEQQRMAELLSRARDYARNGDLFVEPGENAIDAYNNVLRIHPNNDEARAGMAALPARAKELFEQALGGNRLNAAYEYFDALRELSSNDADIGTMRDRLVRAYVDKAKAMNAADKADEAKRAAAKARELAPNSPVTAELANLL